MSKLSKILVTLLVIVVFIFLFAAVGEMSRQAGMRGPGILGLIVFGGMIGAMRAIWKKNKPNEDNNDSKNNESGMLQK